ncbi:MAG: DUF6941 family protein, partial [Verrucomicrobiota bacterium]
MAANSPTGVAAESCPDGADDDREQGAQDVIGPGFTSASSWGMVTSLKLEIFTLCDSAVDYGGKVCILGAFDSVAAAEVPYTVTHCAVVARMRFHRIEEGNHKLRVTLADQDGKMIMPNVDAQVGVRFTEKAQSATFNLV